MRQFDINNVDLEMLDIVKEFPEIFLEPSDEVAHYYEQYGTNPDNVSMCNKKENLINLRYGFEHDNGWKEIVRGFCRDIQDLCNRAKANGDRFQYKGCIMKEKFGQFTPQGDLICDKESWNKYRDEYYAICNKWEKKSLTICEVTGKEGKLRTRPHGWVRTLCDEEAKKQGYE